MSIGGVTLSDGRRSRRTRGLYWEHLAEDKIAALIKRRNSLHEPATP